MKEIGELQPIRSVGQTVEDYFIQAMQDMLNKQAFLLPQVNTNIRNEAYYEKLNSPSDLNPDSHCPCCGKAYEDTDW